MREDKDEMNRPEAYPKPTEVDRQLKHQDEFNEQVSDIRMTDQPLGAGDNDENIDQQQQESMRNPNISENNAS